MTESSVQTPNRAHAVIGVVRAVLHLAAIVAVTWWGFVAWPLPLPGVIFGVLALILSMVLWALFLSPKPVLRTDRFAQSMVELFLYASAVAALIDLGVHWGIAAAFGVVGAILGFIVGASRER